jgi:hypothetical protein
MNLLKKSKALFLFYNLLIINIFYNKKKKKIIK